jgi:hypothetical protein
MTLGRVLITGLSPGIASGASGTGWRLVALSPLGASAFGGASAGGGASGIFFGAASPAGAPAGTGATPGAAPHPSHGAGVDVGVEQESHVDVA